MVAIGWARNWSEMDLGKWKWRCWWKWGYAARCTSLSRWAPTVGGAGRWAGCLWWRNSRRFSRKICFVCDVSSSSQPPALSSTQSSRSACKGYTIFKCMIRNRCWFLSHIIANWHQVLGLQSWKVTWLAGGGVWVSLVEVVLHLRLYCRRKLLEDTKGK